METHAQASSFTWIPHLLFDSRGWKSSRVRTERRKLDGRQYIWGNTREMPDGSNTNVINWKRAMPYCPNQSFNPLFLHLFFPELGSQFALSIPYPPSLYLLSLSLGFLSRYENCHERRRHERRGAERGCYTRSLCQGLAVRHTVSLPPFSPTSFCVDGRPRLV